MANRHQFGLGAEKAFEVLKDQFAFIVDRRNSQLGAFLFESICQGTMLEWCSIAVMTTSSPAPTCARP